MPARPRHAARSLACALLLMSVATAAGAHGMAPVLLEIVAGADGTASVLWKTAASRPRGANLEPVLPERCRAIGIPVAGTTTEGVTRSQEIDCGPEGLVGATVAVRDLDVARTDAMLHLVLPDGREIRTVLRGDRPAFVVPPRATGADAFAHGLRNGVSRVAGRVDVLLFVMGLVLLARDPGALALAVGALVLGSSATLLATGFGWLDPRPALADFLVAASAVAIAGEAASTEPFTPGRAMPWIPAVLLGTAQGFALASSALASAPGEEPGPIALLGLHLGVESSVALSASAIGIAWLGLRAVLARAPSTGLPADLTRAAAYPVGCAAAFLAIERAARLFG